MPKKGNKKNKSSKTMDKKRSSVLPMNVARVMESNLPGFRQSGPIQSWMSTWYGTNPAMRWPELEWAQTQNASMKIMDEGDMFIAEVEMPGIPKEHIDLKVSDITIEVCGEYIDREEGKKGEYMQERTYSRCIRRMPLPEEIVPEKCEAEYKNGILRVKLPKKSPSKRKSVHRVEVK